MKSDFFFFQIRPKLLLHTVLRQILVQCFTLRSQSEQSCRNSSDVGDAVVRQSSQFCSGRVTRIDITNMADSGNGSHQWKETDSRNPHFLPASRAQLQRGDKLPEMSILPWESCGESLTHVVKAKPWNPEILDKICFCEFVRSHHSWLWLCIHTHIHTSVKS